MRKNSALRRLETPFGRVSAPEIHRRVNDFLDRIGHPARFDDQGRFVREAFAVKAAPELERLPLKKELLEDLSRLLSAGAQVAVLFIDLDNFKAVNDRAGHEEGDRCLGKAVGLIGSVLVGKGRPYRVGGDEFVAVLPNFDKAEAAATSERIRRAIDDENPGGSVKVTASIGVAVATPTTHKSAEDMVKAADSAMYKAKHSKNTVSLFEEPRP